MSNSSIDEDTAIALVAGLLAAICLALAARSFARGAIVTGVAWSIGAIAFGFAAWFFAAFRMRMF